VPAHATPGGGGREPIPNLDEILRARQERIDELHRLQPGRTALLVIDMQRGFLDPGAALEVPAGRTIIPNLRRLITACRGRDVPVIFT
jgi:ureidoacrylate peracid hydrolase